MVGDVHKVFINGKPVTQVSLTGWGTSTEPIYSYDCGEGNTFYCPPGDPENYAAYGMTFNAEDESTYKMLGPVGLKYEILKLEGP